MVLVNLMHVCRVAQSYPTLYKSMDCSLPGSSVHEILGKNTPVDCYFLFQRIFPTQGLNPRLLHCCIGRWGLFHWATWEVWKFWTVWNLTYPTAIKKWKLGEIYKRQVSAQECDFWEQGGTWGKYHNHCSF